MYNFLLCFWQRFRSCCGVCSFLKVWVIMWLFKTVTFGFPIDRLCQFYESEQTFSRFFATFLSFSVFPTFRFPYCCDEMTYLQYTEKGSSLWRPDVSMSDDSKGRAGGNRMGSCQHSGETLQLIKISDLTHWAAGLKIFIRINI